MRVGGTDSELQEEEPRDNNHIPRVPPVRRQSRSRASNQYLKTFAAVRQQLLLLLLLLLTAASSTLGRDLNRAMDVEALTGPILAEDGGDRRVPDLQYLDEEAFSVQADSPFSTEDLSKAIK